MSRLYFCFRFFGIFPYSFSKQLHTFFPYNFTTFSQISPQISQILKLPTRQLATSIRSVFRLVNLVLLAFRDALSSGCSYFNNMLRPGGVASCLCAPTQLYWLQSRSRRREGMRGCFLSRFYGVKPTVLIICNRVLDLDIFV